MFVPANILARLILVIEVRSLNIEWRTVCSVLVGHNLSLKNLAKLKNLTGTNTLAYLTAELLANKKKFYNNDARLLEHSIVGEKKKLFIFTF